MQKFVLFVFISTAMLFTYMANYLDYPFIPIATNRRDISLIWTGVIFSIFELFQCILSPLVAVMIIVVGLKESLVLGCFCGGMAAIIIGISDSFPTNTGFISVVCGARSLCAAGNTLIQTSVVVIIATVFQEHKTKAFGVAIMCRGLGGAMSPYIGGWLFVMGGFQLPFLCTGSVLIIIAVMGISFLKEIKYETFTKESSWSLFIKVLSIPSIVLAVLCHFTVGILTQCVLTTLSSYLLVLSKNEIRPEEVGEIFMFLWYSFPIASLLVGYVNEHWIKGDLMLIFGLTLHIIELLLIGPSPLLHLPPRKDYNLIRFSMFLQGCALPTCLISTLNHVQFSAKNAGLPESIQVHSCISSICILSINLGEVVGSLLGGYLVETIFFEWATTVINLWLMTLTVLFTLHSIAMRIKRKMKRSQ